ncbi:MAG TPA: signal peptidase I [Gaiellaceae bacterium]|nr:signal peptidase I [Gaiellaceae bacterium]
MKKRRPWWRKKRALIPATLVSLVIVLLLLGTFGFLVLSFGEGSSGAPTLPACEGGLIAEGFTYRFRNPRRGEIVNFHIRGRIGEPVAPDPDGSDFIAKRVIGVPGDRITWQNSRVLVNGHKADDIPTPEFAPVRLRDHEYFLLGDNRSSSQDSRDFGPVPRNAIFSRVILVWWPLSRFGPVGYDRQLTPPGPVSCD